jgi:hypothetical protein
MEKQNKSKSGLTGTPTGFYCGATFVPSGSFRWSKPMTVKSVEWFSERGGYFQLTMSDDSKPICLFANLPSDEDRRLVANAVRASVESEPSAVVQLAVAGRSPHSAYFSGIRLHQAADSTSSNDCPW